MVKSSKTLYIPQNLTKPSQTGYNNEIQQLHSYSYHYEKKKNEEEKKIQCRKKMNVLKHLQSYYHSVILKSTWEHNTEYNYKQMTRLKMIQRKI